MFGQTAVSLFPVQNYNFGEKAAQPSKDTSVEARIQRIRQQCVAPSRCKQPCIQPCAAPTDLPRFVQCPAKPSAGSRMWSTLLLRVLHL